MAVRETSLEFVLACLAEADQTGRPVVSAIGHEVTAGLISTLLGRNLPYNRVNISGDDAGNIIAVIPQFRADEAREFTREEVEAKGWRYFIVSDLDTILTQHRPGVY